MESSTTMQKPSEAGLQQVRMRAKNQKQVRLSKTPSEDQCPRSSMHQIKSLKTREAEAREQLDCPVEDINMIAAFWGWFQRSIGNRE
jgi:hypothetical protein